MHNKDLLGLLSLHLQPVDESVFIRVAGHELKGADFRPHSDLLSKELNRGKTIQKLPPHRSLTLVSHKDDGTFRPPQVVLQVVPDASGLAHAAGGNDDLGGRVGVQCHGFLRGAGKLQPGETDGLKAVFQQLYGLLVGIAGQVAVVNLGGLQCQRAIHIYRKVGVRFHQPPRLDLTDVIQQLLGAPHRKGGDHHIATPGQCPVYDLGKILGHILTGLM